MYWKKIKEDLDSIIRDKEVYQEVVDLMESYISEEMSQKKISQKKGIEKARKQGVNFGRPKIKEPDNFDSICEKYFSGELNANSAAEICGMGVSTFYRRVRIYEEKE